MMGVGAGMMGSFPRLHQDRLYAGITGGEGRFANRPYGRLGF